MVASQYPYVLQVLLLTGNTQDADGNYIPQTETWTNLCRCRDESGNGKSISTVDGEIYPYSFLIQMPKGVDPLAPGTQVRVMDGSTVRATGKVVYSRKDQLHSRAWA
jgi:hypothetical protein